MKSYTVTIDIPIAILRYTVYVVDKKNVTENEPTSYNIAIREFKQNAYSKWRMFVATLTSSINVPAAGSEPQGIAIFGAVDDTLHFRIDANIYEDTGAQLRERKKGKNGNVIAELVEPGKHAYKQGTIIKGSVIGSSLIGPLEGQPISKLIKLIEEEKVSVNLYLSSSIHGSIGGIIHRARRAVLKSH